MIPAKNECSRVGAGLRAAGLMVLCLSLSASPAVGGPDGQTMLESARVVANGAVALLGQPALSNVLTPAKVAANRPLSLSRDAASTEPDPCEPAAPLQVAMVYPNDEPAEAREAEPADRQEPTKIRPEDAMIESIQVGGEHSEELVVPRNSTAVINLKSKVDGVEIADPKIADVVLTSPTRILVVGKAYGVTQLVLRVGSQERTLAINVELNLRQLQNLVKSIAPTADVQARSINGVVVLMGRVPDHETAERVVELASLAQGGEVRNQLTVAGVQQTMLRVVVAEVNKTALRTLNMNWAIGGSDWTRDFFFANNLGSLNPTTFTSSGLANVLSSNQNGGQLTYSLGAVGNGVNTNVTFGFPKAELQFFLNALRENQLARILAEPNLVAINGQTATFLAGGEVPIPVTQGGAVAGSITIEYKEFGVRLAFTPTGLGGQIIRLHVMSEVSDAVPGERIAGTLPVFTFTTRRVESTIECGNGQTFAIAGLLREQVRSVADKLPGLGDIPVLGAMFSSVRYQKDETELLVLVTPQLVAPLEPHQVGPPPGALMRDPNDFELFGLGKLEGQSQTPPDYEGVPRDDVSVNTHPSETKGDGSLFQDRSIAGGVRIRSFDSTSGFMQRTPVPFALHGPWGLAEADEN